MKTDQLDIFLNPPNPPLPKGEQKGDLHRIHGDALTREEDAVLRLLDAHRGRSAAITGEAMAQDLSMSYDRIRAVVAHLVNRHDILIASCSAGYYIPVTPGEIDAVVQSLQHRAIAILIRAAKLRNVSLEVIFGQLKMELLEGSAK